MLVWVVIVAVMATNAEAAPPGSASRALVFLSNDTMDDLQPMCAAFAAELDLFLSTAGSVDGMRSVSGLAGKCVWSSNMFRETCRDPGVTNEYSGPMNPWGVTTKAPCLPECRLNVTSMTKHWHMNPRTVTCEYTDYVVEPDAYIYAAANCWHVQRVDDMVFRVTTSFNGARKGSRPHIALVRSLKALGWTVRIIDEISWTMGAKVSFADDF